MIRAGNYTLEQIDKLGNSMIYLTEKLGKLSKTKVLKLIYILEEVSISKHGTPFFNIPFEVWKLGPVPKDIFVQLSNDLTYLSDFVRAEDDEGGRFIEAKGSFNDDEFSDNDIDILDLVVDKFGSMETSVLIEYTHRSGSLWEALAKKFGLIDYFNTGLSSSSEIKIDFSQMLQEDTFKHMVYKDYLEYFEASQPLITQNV